MRSGSIASSAQALAFRRAGSSRSRSRWCSRPATPAPSCAGLPELELEGLADADAQALLASVIGGPLDERVRDRMVHETGGNPLALTELPRGLTPAQVAGGFGLPHVLGLSGRIEDSFLRRLDELPADTRRLLLIAASEPVGDPALVRQAAELLGIDREAAEPAHAAGLLELGAAVWFRHPLVRSAVYRTARPTSVAPRIGRSRRRPSRRSTPTAAPGIEPHARRARRGRRGRARALGRPRAGAAAASPRRPRSWSGPRS